MTAVTEREAVQDRSAEASPFDKLAYLFALVGLYVMVGGLFFYGFWGKAIDGDFKIPPPLEEHPRATRKSSVASSLHIQAAYPARVSFP